MVKTKTKFVCQNCGASFPKWQGQCSQCQEWNTLVEETESAGNARGMSLSANQWSEQDLEKILVKRSEVKAVSASKQRFSSSIGELDRVLGGGIVPGEIILIGGEPGIGKSTLLTQMILGVLLKKSQVKASTSDKKSAKQKPNKMKKIFYVSGEESPAQINLRINRILENEQFLLFLNYAKNKKPDLSFLDDSLQFITSTDVDQLRLLMAKHEPDLVIVDSIQTLSTQDLSGASGSVGQVREVTERLRLVGKSLHIPLFLVGHVTKDGTIAGPKTLEHMVDSVVELSGERTGKFRLLRALKNRFGATDEVGVFQFTDYGLAEVNNPSLLFLDQQQNVPGSAVCCVMEGTRPLLVEVQALASRTQLAIPRRVGQGIELSRIQVLSAVLQKHCRVSFADYDLFVNAAGGFRIKEPAVDLALAAAMVSSVKNKKIPSKTVFIGEVGLLGEIRPVSYLERRVKEAKRLGFKKIITSKKYQRLDQLVKKMF